MAWILARRRWIPGRDSRGAEGPADATEIELVTALKALLLVCGLGAAGGAVAYGTGALDPYLPGHRTVVASLPPAQQPASTNPAPRPTTSPATGPAAAPTSDRVNGTADQAKPADANEQPAVKDGVIVPQFDLVRVEPDGSMVVAGHAAPNASIELVAGSKVLGTTRAGPQGDFAIVLDKPLDPGDYQFVLRSTAPGNVVSTSVQTAVVSVPDTRQGQVLVLVQEPGKPSELISVPTAQGQASQVAEAGNGDRGQPAQQQTGQKSASRQAAPAAGQSKQTEAAAVQPPQKSAPAQQAQPTTATAEDQRKPSAQQQPAASGGAGTSSEMAAATNRPVGLGNGQPSGAAAEPSASVGKMPTLVAMSGSVSRELGASARGLRRARKCRPARSPPHRPPSSRRRPNLSRTSRPRPNSRPRPASRPRCSRAGNPPRPGRRPSPTSPSRRRLRACTSWSRPSRSTVARSSLPARPPSVAPCASTPTTPLLGQSVASPGGRFLVSTKRDLPVGDYIIRADLLSDDGSTVLARAAVPFEREAGESMAAVAPGSQPRQQQPGSQQPQTQAGAQVDGGQQASAELSQPRKQASAAPAAAGSQKNAASAPASAPASSGQQTAAAAPAGKTTQEKASATPASQSAGNETATEKKQNESAAAGPTKQTTEQQAAAAPQPAAPSQSAENQAAPETKHDRAASGPAKKTTEQQASAAPPPASAPQAATNQSTPEPRQKTAMASEPQQQGKAAEPGGEQPEQQPSRTAMVEPQAGTVPGIVQQPKPVPEAASARTAAEAPAGTAVQQATVTQDSPKPAVTAEPPAQQAVASAEPPKQPGSMQLPELNTELSQNPPVINEPKLQNVEGAVIIRRGDNLWRISQRVYGHGIRYTTIYLANQDEIRDPNMIWPGQVFTVPDKTNHGETADLSVMGDQATTVPAPTDRPASTPGDAGQATSNPPPASRPGRRHRSTSRAYWRGALA